jgi:hypothetical protein
MTSNSVASFGNKSAISQNELRQIGLLTIANFVACWVLNPNSPIFALAVAIVLLILVVVKQKVVKQLKPFYYSMVIKVCTTKPYKKVYYQREVLSALAKSIYVTAYASLLWFVPHGASVDDVFAVLALVFMFSAFVKTRILLAKWRRNAVLDIDCNEILTDRLGILQVFDVENHIWRSMDGRWAVKHEMVQYLGIPQFEVYPSVATKPGNLMPYLLKFEKYNS